MKKIPMRMDRCSTGVIVDDPVLLASLRLSPEAAARIERLERSTSRPTPRILLD